MQDVLLLNSSYQPLRIIPWQRAIELWYREKANIVEYYDETLRSPSITMKYPAVVRLNHYVRQFKRPNIIRLSRLNVYTRDNFSCQYCITPEHKILTSDLKWVSAGGLKIGDSLVGFDEYSETRRHYKPSVVTSHVLENQDIYKVILDDGSSIRVTKDHLWLCRKSSKYIYKWIKTIDLVGKELPKLFDVWEHDKSYESSWVAGIIDGEGCLRPKNGLNIAIAQNPGRILNDLKAELKNKNFSLGESKVNNKGCCIRLVPHGGTPEAARMLGVFRPRRLLDTFEPSQLGALRATKWCKVVSVEKEGFGTIVKMQTSSATFIAEGFPHHNCGKQPGTKKLTLDHVMPKSRGGPFSWTNIATACLDCNYIKADMTPEEARLPLLSIPREPKPTTKNSFTAGTGFPKPWLPYFGVANEESSNAL